MTGPRRRCEIAAPGAESSPRERRIMPNERGQGPKFRVNIDDVDYPWEKDTITAADIRALAGIPAGTEILEVNLKTNEERTLVEGVPVDIKPGQGFGKKIKFKRG
jgi:hypothetical protein